jgi:hypothetical protein
MSFMNRPNVAPVGVLGLAAGGLDDSVEADELSRIDRTTEHLVTV